MRKLLLINFLILILLVHGNETFAQWIATNGPNSGSVSRYAISGNTIYAGSDGLALFKSINDGYSWEPLLGLNTEKSVLCLAVAGTSVFSGIKDDGLFRSTDAGTTWLRKSNGLAQFAAMRVFSMTNSGNTLILGTLMGLYTSTDDGENWIANPNLTSQIYSLVNVGTNTYAGTSSGVYISADNGQIWTKLNNAPIAPVGFFAVNGSELYAGTTTDGGVYLSADNGATWNLKLSGICYGLGATSTHVFAYQSSGSSYGFFQSSDSGTNWNYLGRPGGSGGPIATKGTTVFTGGLRSDDNGASFTFVALPTTSVYCLLMKGNTLFAGVGAGPSAYTNDGGLVWTPMLTAPADVYSLCSSGSNLFAGTFNNGVFRSSDNGLTWVEKKSGLTANNIKAMASDGLNIFAGTDNGVFLSVNDGDSWTQVNTGLTNTTIHALAILGTTIFAGTDGGGVFISTNNGAIWNASNSGITQTKVVSFAVSGSNIYAGTRGGGAAYKSENAGATWTRLGAATLPTGQPIHSILVSGTNLFAATLGGVYLSVNDGSTWIVANTGLTNTNIYALTSDGTRLYAATAETGGSDGRAVFSRLLSDFGVTGVKETNLSNDAMIYPNPVMNEMYVELSDYKNAEVKIFTSKGDIILSKALENQTSTLDISGLKEGIYFVKVINSTGVSVKKLIKE